MKRVINGTVLIRCAALKFACCDEECSPSCGAIELRVAWIVIEKFWQRAGEAIRVLPRAQCHSPIMT